MTLDPTALLVSRWGRFSVGVQGIRLAVFLRCGSLSQPKQHISHTVVVRVFHQRLAPCIGTLAIASTINSHNTPR